MKGSNLGELEELIMLHVALLFDEAYGVAIMKEVKRRPRSIARSVTSNAAYVKLMAKRHD